MWPVLAILVFLLIVLLLIVFLMRPSPTPPDRFGLGYMDDGLWELYIGLIFLLLGIAEWLGFAAVGIIPALLYPLLLMAKQAITLPRLRPAERSQPPPTQRRMSALLLLGLVVLLGVTFFVFIQGSTPNGILARSIHFLPSAIWLLIILVLVGAGYRRGIPRLYYYAALGLAAWPALNWLHLPLPIYALLLGAGICLGSLTVLARFVQDHPKLTTN